MSLVSAWPSSPSIFPALNWWITSTSCKNMSKRDDAFYSSMRSLPPHPQLAHCSPFLSLLFSSVFLPGEQAAHWEQQLRPGIQQINCDLKFTWGHRVLISPKHMKQSLSILVSVYDSPDTTDLPVFLLGFSRHKHRVSAKGLPVTAISATGVVENKTRIIFKHSTRVICTLFLQWEI